MMPFAMLYPHIRTAALYTAAWTPVVLVFLTAITAASPLTLAEALGAAVRSVGIAALLGVLVLGAARRRPWPASLTLRFVMHHAAASLLYAAGWLSGMAALLWFALGSAHAVTVNMSPWWGWQMAFGVLVYWVIAGVAWATAAARISQERSLALMEAEAARVKSELGALRGQLDPHFLFNTLHTAAVLARHDPPAAATAIERLAELLRYVLDSRRGAREDVPLRDELAFVDAYLALESLRLGDRLRVVREIADDALGVAVPSLTLQPLVENALRYGISPRRGGGTLTVRGHLRDGELLLEVGDDGPGAATIDPPQGTGIGLSTLRQRLTARFGSRACMHVRSAPGDGFFVLLRIPA